MRNLIASFLVLFFSFCFVFESAAQRGGGVSRKPWCTVGDSIAGGAGSEEAKFNERGFNSAGRLINSGGKIIIPVVVHVLYHPSVPAQNVSDTYIDQQLEILNEDLNPQSLAVPAPFSHMTKGFMAVELRRACIDPQGNPTTGIIRKQMPSAGPYTATITNGIMTYPDLALAELGGSAAWPTDKYLNIWIGNMDEPYGLAMFPWNRNNITTVNINSVPTAFSNTNFDGITLDYEIFPEPMLDPNDPVPLSDKNRVPTHEMGHWLGLYHIYSGCGNEEDDGDKVDDTPAQYIANLVCPSTSGGTITHGLCPDEDDDEWGIMYLNYMDLSPSACMKLFTPGQRTRARSYFSQTGPTGTRYPFLQNYFSIKQPYQLQNNTLTVFLNNPACINVTYSFTGPVTEISHDNQKIVFSVACPSTGTVSVTATAENYVDDYTFSFTNNTCYNGMWPKVYIGKSPEFLIKDNYDNIFMGIHYGRDLTNNLNHEGILPSSPAINGDYTFQYNLSGITNWTHNERQPLYALSSGVICLRNRNTSSWAYVNSTDGLPASLPNWLPQAERIVAEKNGIFITNSANAYYIRSASGTNIVNSDYISKAIFNPSTNKLFAIEIGSVVYFRVYTLSNNTLTLDVNNSIVINDIQYPGEQGLDQVSLQDKVYVVDQGELKEYNYALNTLTPVAISGFTNNNIKPIISDDLYAGNKILVLQANENRIYSIDLVSLTSKWINSSDPSQGGPLRYLFQDTDVYIAGVNQYMSTTIGNQQIPVLDADYPVAFLTKFNLQNDFSRQVSFLEKKRLFEVTLFPNPVTQSMRISIQDLSFSGKDKKYMASVFDQSGNRMLRKENYQPGTELNTAILKPGVYYLEITDQFGERTGKTFMKL